MVLKLTRTDIAFVKGQKKMMDSFKKKIEKEVDKITLANTAIADWNEKIESIDKFTVGLYGKTVTEIMGIIEVEEQPPLIVQDKATGEYVPNPEAVGEEEEEKEEETPEVEEEQIPDSVPDKQENIESELKMRKRSTLQKMITYRSRKNLDGPMRIPMNLLLKRKRKRKRSKTRWRIPNGPIPIIPMTGTTNCKPLICNHI